MFELLPIIYSLKDREYKTTFDINREEVIRLAALDNTDYCARDTRLDAIQVSTLRSH